MITKESLLKNFLPVIYVVFYEEEKYLLIEFWCEHSTLIKHTKDEMIFYN